MMQQQQRSMDAERNRPAGRNDYSDRQLSALVLLSMIMASLPAIANSVIA
jgi:hypothetical protein